MSMLGAWFLWVTISAAYHGTKAYFGYPASLDEFTACAYWTGCAFLAIRIGVIRP